MKYGLLIVVLLSGCASQQEQIAEFKKTCSDMGFQIDTTPHAECVSKLYSDRQNAARALIKGNRASNVRVIN